jgi:hypothetical protein
MFEFEAAIREECPEVENAKGTKMPRKEKYQGRIERAFTRRPGKLVDYDLRVCGCQGIAHDGVYYLN